MYVFVVRLLPRNDAWGWTGFLQETRGHRGGMRMEPSIIHLGVGKDTCSAELLIIL